MVNVYPVKASGFIRESLLEERELLLRAGILPINDVFLPYYGDRSQIRLFYGSYGSGKSVFIADDLIDKCLNDEYFRCYYGRKIFDTVRASQFETLIDRIEERGLRNYFKYSRADNSSMVILCLLNGNKFMPFGGDKAEKLKSIKDPSHIWCEEFDQFDDANIDENKPGDFQILFPRLRTTKAKCEFIGTFNTAPVYETHWILKYFFPDLYKGEDKPESWFKDIIAGLQITYCFANYTDNYFINQEEYYKQLQLASGGNQLTLNAIAKGAWGMIDNTNPWLYNFIEEKHVKDILFLPGFPIYVSFDFNVNPFACTIWQKSPQNGGSNAFIHCIDEVTSKIKLEEMCSIIKSRYPKSIIYVTGDKSGRKEELGLNQTLYQSIATNLGISTKNLNLNNINLEHSDSRELLNTMLWSYPNIYIHPRCETFITDCKIARIDIKNPKPSHLLKDRKKFKMDTFDSGRYFFQTYFLEYAQKTYWKGLKK